MVTHTHDHAGSTGPGNAAGRRERGPLDEAKKWIGLGAALVSFGSALYGVLEYQADKRAHERTVADLIATSRTEQGAGDYTAAWESLQRATKVLDGDQGLVRLFNGLSAEQERVHAAQQDLAMEWLRITQTPWGGPGHSEITDHVLGVLSAGVEHAGGPRQADLLAHIGWAYCLKQRDGVTNLHPETFFIRALTVEPANPYAHAFWGYWILARTGSPENHSREAIPHFVIAAASPRSVGAVREWVRQRQIDALSFPGWWKQQAAAGAWWQAVSEMDRAGEPFPSRLLGHLYSQYAEDLDDERGLAAFQKDLDRDLKYAPIELHVRLLQKVLDWTDPDPHAGGLHNFRVFAQVALANGLERAGRSGEALTVWKQAHAQLRAGALDDNWHLAPVVDAAIQRLGAAASAHG